ncbi:hypothetical protein [Pandoraea sp. NPDC090278]|uniref:hypothetical protein n=1 Tax=Pandoraea sp. NPDC090278 TaxID=3364391 RepID=UPI00383AB566
MNDVEAEMQRIAAEAHFTSRAVFALIDTSDEAFEAHLYLSQFRRKAVTRILHSTAHATPQRAPPKEKHHADHPAAHRRLQLRFRSALDHGPVLPLSCPPSTIALTTNEI